MLETVKNPAKITRAFVWFMLVAFFATISINSSAQSVEDTIIATADTLTTALDSGLTVAPDAEVLPAESDTMAADSATEVVTPVEPVSQGSEIIFWFVVVLILLVVWAVYSTLRSVHKTMDENGYLDFKDPNKDYLKTFLIILGATCFVIFLLKTALASNTPGFTTLMFGGLPYIALAVFIIGSIFRYKNIGFKVSSLSSQFLEGKQLFFGSQPFHWGMLVLFLGHLIAFMIPKAVILWNGHPVRLFILEITSLVFAISALVGLILLIKRRLGNRRIMVVTNNMDTLVYVILLVQIVSGISIALFARWGSTWFASSLTPYLRSIFVFDPQTATAAAMPWYAQIHIISAFFIIAIIPFTRFMHFLVAPIHYIWRKYQVVYWNWNRKTIRKSTAHTYGKLPRNH